jgi:hypothetical protein
VWIPKKKLQYLCYKSGLDGGERVSLVEWERALSAVGLGGVGREHVRACRELLKPVPVLVPCLHNNQVIRYLHYPLTTLGAPYDR